MICPICCTDDITAITCSYCQFSACPACTKRFLMESSTTAPRCMGCRKEWSIEFVMEHIPEKSWLAAYIAEHLFDAEKRLLPTAQKDANLMIQIRDLRAQVQRMPSIKTMQKRRYANDRIDQKRQEKHDIIHRITALKSQCSLFHEIDDQDTTPAPVKKTTKTTYIKSCPMDNCRGYINNLFVCETCHTQLCDRCHAHKPTTGPHRCDPNDVLSAREIMSSTRQCPKCFVPIWKINGCNQIFCTACHCIFDWETGKEDNGIAHNPHYFEWLASNANTNANITEIENIACGDIPPPHVFAAYVNKSTLLFHIYRILNHIRVTIQPEYTIDQVKDNHDLRVGFLAHDFDEATFKLKIYNREKRRMKLRAFNDLIALEVNILADIVRTVVYTKTWSITDIQNTYNNLKAFHEQTIHNIAKIHGGAILHRYLFTTM
jgi:hypothetical protein